MPGQRIFWEIQIPNIPAATTKHDLLKETESKQENKTTMMINQQQKTTRNNIMQNVPTYMTASLFLSGSFNVVRKIRDGRTITFGAFAPELLVLFLASVAYSYSKMLRQLDKTERKLAETEHQLTIEKLRLSQRAQPMSLLSSTESGLVVELTTKFLSLPDVCNCIKSCKLLKEVLDTDKVWKDVALALSPFGTMGLDAVVNGRNNDPADAERNTSTRFSYRSMARMFATNSNKSAVYEEVELPQSKLQLENFYAMVEIRDAQTKEQFSVFGGNLSQFRDNLHNDGYHTKSGMELPPGKVTSFTFNDAVSDAIRSRDQFADFSRCQNQFEFSMKLFRLDTGEAVSLNQGYTKCEDADSDSVLFVTHFVRPTAPNSAGTIATTVLAAQNTTHAQFVARVGWERTSESEVTINTCNLSAFLSDVDYSFDGYFNTPNEMLLFLDGLEWK